jgi:hypothetical protein
MPVATLVSPQKNKATNLVRIPGGRQGRSDPAGNGFQHRELLSAQEPGTFLNRTFGPDQGSETVPSPACVANSVRTPLRLM